MGDQVGRGARQEIDGPLAVNIIRAPGASSAKMTDALVSALVGLADGWGPRIPVNVSLLAEGELSPVIVRADKTLVAVLMDFDMLDPTSEDRYKNLAAIESLVADGRSGGTGVLPIAIGPVLNTLPAGLRTINIKRVEPGQHDEVTLHVVIGCLRVLKDEAPVSTGVRPSPRAFESSRVSVFLSHAKVDYASHAKSTVDTLFESDRRFGIETWFDSARIQPGQDFQVKLEQELRRCDVMLAVLTDSYSDREWCRREFFVAKSSDKPIVVVDALLEGSPRLFPYIGNVPIVRWEPMASPAGSYDDPTLTRDNMRLIVVLQTLRQALMFQYNRGVLGSLVSGAWVLASTPELLTLPRAASTGTVVYPDPPLSRDEEVELESRYDSLKLVTPLTLLAPAAASGTTIALSISEGEASRSGCTVVHLGAFWNDLNLALLRCGYRLLYGGLLGYTSATGVNFALRLAELALSHSPLLERLGSAGVIHNIRAWPNTLTFEEKGRFGDFFTTYPDASPPELPSDVIQRDRRYASAVALTQMRVKSTHESVARVAAGGKLDGYSGHMPGVIEELYQSIKAGQPTYLVGLGGGATRCVIDLLEGLDRPELDAQWCREHVNGWADLDATYRSGPHASGGPEAARDCFVSLRSARWTHPSLANNGLTPDENEELAHTVDVRRAVALLVHGLKRLDHGAVGLAARPPAVDPNRATTPRSREG